MGELVSAQEYAQGILSQTMRSLYATRIQRSWRRCLREAEAEAEAERALAQMNKYENMDGPSWKGGNGEAGAIVDLLEPMEVMKGEDKVTFSPTREARENNDETYNETLDCVDGKEKGTVKFCLLVNSWFSFVGEKKKFFEGFAKVWVDDPSSENWTEYLESVIKSLENGEVVRLWGDFGGCKIINPTKKGKIKELRDYWLLYLIKREIKMLKEGQNTSFNPEKMLDILNTLQKEEQPVCYAYPVVS